MSKSVRGLEGKEAHRRLMEECARLLERQGYSVVFQAKVAGLRIDVLGIKGDERVGVECQILPMWKKMEERARKCRGFLTKFMVAIPSSAAVRQPPPEGVEVLRLDVPGSKIVRLDLDVYEELVRAKGELTAKEGRSMSLSDALRRMIEAWYEKAREEVKVTKAKCSSCGREFYADAEARLAICPHCGTVLRREEVRA